MSCDIAILVYRPLKKKRKNDSFDGNDNFGALVVKDILNRSGHEVSFCAPETASNHRVVLVSLTSTYDVYSFYRHVYNRPEWQGGARRFKVIVGGFGCQNPVTIRKYIDYALFGRAEGVIVNLVEAALDCRPFDHPSVMSALPEITGVVINQTPSLYPYQVDYQDKIFSESFIGCPNKCKFCHYTWARRAVGHAGEYVNTTLAGSSSPEMTWRQMIQTTGKLGRVRVAIDGFSSRLRHKYGKKISDTDIVDGLHRLGAYGGTTVCIAYNIGNMPTETVADRHELYATLASAQPESRVIIVLHTTPFRPSLATPMQWDEVTLMPNWNAMGGQVIYDSPMLRCVHSTGNEAPYSHLMSVVAERATPDTDPLFHAIATHPKLQSGAATWRVELVRRNYDLSQYLRQYEVDDPHYPGWFLQGIVGRTTLQKLAARLRVAG